ncbi:MAG: hypothetical protein IIW52_02050 [Alistipes sp.]|nr:hypothetical protein [Alistipes sp.]
MKILKFILPVLYLGVALSSCSDNDDFSMEFSQMGLYFQWGGEPQTISYNTVNAASVEMKSVTDGWTCNLDTTKRTITITPPTDPGTDSGREAMREADIRFTITSKSGKSASYTIDCYIIGDSVIFLNDGGKYANSYVLTSPMSAYTLDVSRNGGGQTLSGVAGAKIVWQSKAAMIEHFVYDEENNIVSFYIDALREEDNEEVYVKEDGKYVMFDGNAVIAVVDSSDKILWSWHLWLTKSANNPLEDYSTYSNGVTFMNRNLGSYANSNGATDNTTLILDSYGLYYQWGRKDPFLRPYYHDCAGNEDQIVYGLSSSAVYVTFEETSAKVGTVEYAIANPMTFITNSACVDSENGDGIGDWLHTPDNNLWSGTTKSLYDPCPYGWRVPAGSDFDILSLTAEEDGMSLDAARGRFGWMLSDGVSNHFYLAAGFRSYYDGCIHNMNYKEGVYPSHPEPWEGYYWTAGTTADGKQSTCMYFDLTTTRTINKFNTNYPSKRANAMQIRCVKVK